MSTVLEVRDNNDRREQLVKKLEVYTDSDWASEQTTRKSTSGWQKACGFMITVVVGLQWR